jgi:multiple sugar transport system substrate-binding protein
MDSFRRSFLKKSALFAGALSTTCMYPQFSHAEQKRFAGKTLKLNWPSGVLHFNLARALVRNFSNATGIKVELDSNDPNILKPKVFEACAKSVNEYDLIVFNMGWKAALMKLGYLSDLVPLFSNTSLVLPDYQFDDLVRGYVQAIGMATQKQFDDRLYGIPFGCQTSIFAYRKDVFAQHHLTAPVTYEELQRLLIRIRLRAKMPAMTAALGNSKSVIDSWLLHFFPQGENLFQADWRSNFGSESGLKTLDFLKLIRDTGPDNMLDFNSQESLEAFLKGEAAVYIDSTSVLGHFRNAFPDAHILDRVGYALHPRGHRYAARCDGYGFGIPHNSSEPEAAFLFAQWMSSRESDLTIVKRGGDPQRISTIMNPTIRKLYPEIAILKNQLMQAIPEWRPNIPEWDDMSTTFVANILRSGIKNNAPNEALLSSIDRQLNERMKRLGYIKA